MFQLGRQFSFTHVTGNVPGSLKTRLLVLDGSKPRWIIERSYNGLHLKILIQGLHSKISAKPTHFVPTIWAVNVKSPVTIYPNDTCPYWSRHRVGYVQVIGQNACRQSILCGIGPPNRLLNSPADVPPKILVHWRHAAMQGKAQVKLTWISRVKWPVRRFPPLLFAYRPERCAERRAKQSEIKVSFLKHPRKAQAVIYIHSLPWHLRRQLAQCNIPWRRMVCHLLTMWRLLPCQFQCMIEFCRTVSCLPTKSYYWLYNNSEGLVSCKWKLAIIQWGIHSLTEKKRFNCSMGKSFPYGDKGSTCMNYNAPRLSSWYD